MMSRKSVGKRKKHWLALVGTSAAFISCVPAFAQTAGAIESAEGSPTGTSASNDAAAAGVSAEEAPASEIIVTARRRAEALEDVPLSVNVFTEQSIAEKRIERPADFLQSVPSLLVIPALEAGDVQVVMRGIINARDVDPSYALIVDGAVQPDPFALNRELVDIESIQVVKGPVSALYGRNALGGAIIINTKKPSDILEGKVRAGYGNGDTWFVQGAVSGPIVADVLSASLTAAYKDREGKFDNVFLGGKVDYYTEARIRGRLLFEPTDTFTLNVTSEWADIDSAAVNYVFQGVFPAILPQFANGINVNDTSIPFGPNTKAINPAKRFEVGVNADWQLPIGNLSADFGYQKNRNRLGSDSFIRPVSFPPFAIFEGLSDDFVNANNSLNLLGYSPFPGSQFYQRRDGEFKTLDVKLESETGSQFEWLIGGYYADLSRSVFVSIDRDPGDGSVAPKNLHPGPQTIVVSEDMRTDTKVYSAYFQVSYDLFDQLELALAGRYDKEERVSTNLVDPRFVALPSLVQYTGLVREVEFDRFQPHISARWKATDALTVYANYGEGFRAGGFNAPGTRDTVLNVDRLPPSVNIFDEYDEEIVKGWEAGFNADLLDRRLTVGATYYQTNSHNTQLFDYTPITSSRARTNIDKTVAKGIELEANGRLTDSLSINAGYAYTSAKIRKFTNNPFAEGEHLPFVPRTTVNLGATHRMPVFSDFELVSHADYNRIGKTPFEPNNAPGTVRNPVSLVNARLALESENLSFALWGQNVFNKRYNVDNVIVLFASPAEVIPPSAFVNAAYRDPGRAYGVEATFRF